MALRSSHAPDSRYSATTDRSRTTSSRSSSLARLASAASESSLSIIRTLPCHSLPYRLPASEELRHAGTPVVSFKEQLRDVCFQAQSGGKERLFEASEG